jgi:ABC-2 type transport system ATP-binding protein
MRQKLALARALLHAPPVLLLDEPTSAMDPESARLVRDALADLRSADRTIVLCTHNLAEAEELADRIAIMRRGRIIASGSPQELKDQLLGPPEYVVRFATPLNGRLPVLPAGVEPAHRGADWLSYRGAVPATANPAVLTTLLEQGFAVVGLQEAPRSLENVYLHAVSAHDQSGARLPAPGDVHAG